VGAGGGIAGEGWCAGYNLTRTIVRDNTAGGYGGGVYINGSDTCKPGMGLTSSLVTGNQALAGGAAYVGPNGSLNVSGSTLAGNTASTAGSIIVEPGGGIGISDSIVYFNSSDPVLPEGVASYSDIEGGYAGIGVIGIDPLFVDAAAGNFALREDSPCQDTAGGGVNFDLLNNCRPLGAGFDMGAYEFVPAGSDADGDGYLVCADCNDNDPAVNPAAVEVCDGVDNDCNGSVDEGFDIDQDGFTTCAGDCNDADGNIRPGASEIIRDGSDQDCNGYDLTIVVTRAEWSKKRTLTVEATSLRGAQAALVLPDYNKAMSWNNKRKAWTITISGVASNPGSVSVSGPEGAVTADVITR
jgi:hypothetical protein